MLEGDKEEEILWMVRPCELYKEEYSDCRSIKARFHQYFIYGETIDCTQWKRDYDSCVRWKDNKDTKALKELLESEKARRLKRLEGHYKNNVWSKRAEPPSDWNKPLPEKFVKEYENTYLYHRAKQMADDANGKEDQNRTLCVIS